MGGIAKPRRPLSVPPCLHGGRMEGVDFGAALGRECHMLLRAVRVKAVNPENKEIHTIADAIGPVVSGSCMTRRRPSAPRAASKKTAERATSATPMPV